MTANPDRYETEIRAGTIYVGTPDGVLPVGSLATAVGVVGGPSWQIAYSEAFINSHPEVDTSDAGLTVDVVDMINAMTHSERFVRTLAAQPASAAVSESPGPDGAASTDLTQTETETGTEPAAGRPPQTDPPADGAVSPRLGLFVGKLLENLENGVD